MSRKPHQTPTMHYKPTTGRLLADLVNIYIQGERGCVHYQLYKEKGKEKNGGKKIEDGKK